ncbi:MAG: hypothetical protein EXS14_10830 [Planctomycetes bacterium]|nr:hypothetical protein [Planctomycetota bacterium]
MPRCTALVGLMLVMTSTLVAQPTAWNADEARMVNLLRFNNQPLAKLRWEVSVTAARTRAAAEGRPIFMVINTGHCLGYV